MLKGKPLHLVNDLINSSDEIVAITSIENFKLGFRLGVQMICDSLVCDDSIFKDLQLNFNVDKGYLLLTGGGASTFKKAFRKRLNNVIVSEDNVFDNVKGFVRVGEQLWQSNK